MAKARKPAAPTMRDDVFPLERIKPYPNNPRTHPPAQIALLAELLLKRGPDQRIVIDEDGWILKGHGRRAAADLAGLKTFPVVVRTGLSAADKKAMRIEDNQVALLAGWDSELVRIEIGELKTQGYPIELLGFGEAQLVQFMTVPGPPAGGFQQFDENIPTSYECPRCGHKWSGKPTPASDGDKVKAPKAKTKGKKK